MHPTFNEVEIPEDGNNTAHDNTISVGPDMPGLPLDTPPVDNSKPAAQINEEVPTIECQADCRVELEKEGSLGVDTLRNERWTSLPEEEQEEGGLPEQQKGKEKQGGETVLHTGEESKDAEGAVYPESDFAYPAEVETNTEATFSALETPSDDWSPPQQDFTDSVLKGPIKKGETSCEPCQSLFSNCSSQASSWRKTRPCSLPVSELETVIASACSEPETPRSHYIRIHHVLHSLPSARPPTQGEATNTMVDSNATLLNQKSFKEEEGEEEYEEEEDTTQFLSQVKLHKVIKIFFFKGRLSKIVQRYWYVIV